MGILLRRKKRENREALRATRLEHVDEKNYQLPFLSQAVAWLCLSRTGRF